MPATGASIKEMPADREELDNALEDGIDFKELLNPVSYLKGILKCQKMKLGERLHVQPGWNFLFVFVYYWTIKLIGAFFSGRDGQYKVILLPILVGIYQ